MFLRPRYNVCSSPARCAKEEDLKDARNVTARRTFRVRKQNKAKAKKEPTSGVSSTNAVNAGANGM